MCYSSELLYASLLALHFLFFLLDRSNHLLQIASNTSRARILQIINLGHVGSGYNLAKCRNIAPVVSVRPGAVLAIEQDWHANI